VVDKKQGNTKEILPVIKVIFLAVVKGLLQDNPLQYLRTGAVYCSIGKHVYLLSAFNCSTPHTKEVIIEPDLKVQSPALRPTLLPPINSYTRRVNSLPVKRLDTLPRSLKVPAFGGKENNVLQFKLHMYCRSLTLLNKTQIALSQTHLCMPCKLFYYYKFERRHTSRIINLYES
jgi:hypothetical protein